MDVILTVATGTEFCKNPFLQVFFKSLYKCGYKGDTIVFTHDMSEDIRQIVQGYGCQIIDVDPTRIFRILHDRFIFYHEFLAKQTKYKRVMLVDVKDVYFQRNPFEDAPKEIPFVWLAGEGGVHHQNDWNKYDQEKCQSELKDEYKIEMANVPVINAGTILGTTDEIKNLCLLIWSNTLRTQLKFTDQGALNYIHQFLKHDPVYSILTPQEQAWTATGQGIAENWFDPEWRDGKLWLDDRPYALFHQWDRTKYKKAVLEQMGLLFREPTEPVRANVCPDFFEKAVLSFKSITHDPKGSGFPARN